MGSPNSRRQGGGADDTTVDCDLLRRRSIIWIHTFIHGSRVSLDSGLEGSARNEEPANRASSCPRKRHSLAWSVVQSSAAGVADGADGADGIFECARILMILLPSQPPRLNAMSMPNARRKVCARRSEEHTSELQSRGHLVCRP